MYDTSKRLSMPLFSFYLKNHGRVGQNCWLYNHYDSIVGTLLNIYVQFLFLEPFGKFNWWRKPEYLEKQPTCRRSLKKRKSIVTDTNLNIFVTTHIFMLSSKRSNLLVQVVLFIPSFTINVSVSCEFCVVMSVTISTQKRCSVRLYLQLFVGGLMS